MQEIHSIGGGRFFGAGGGGDRRLRTHHHHHQQNRHQQQALKCPRCDSLNTKFCYYNNYNLSQPRHFCKNCRRYWTKGGVLRNVPVGGGCRKSKRSNKPKNSSSETSATAATTSTTSQPPAEPAERKSNSHSSSESSSLTAAAAAAAAATEAMSAPTPKPGLLESKLFLHESTNPGLEMEQGGGGGGGGECGINIFSEMGSFTSLITSTNEALAFGFGNNMNIPDQTSAFRFSTQHGSDPLFVSGGGGGGGQCQWQQQSQKVMGMGISSDHHQDFTTAGFDHTAAHGGFGSLDWHQGAVDQGLFDLPNTVDQAYWTHTPHWSDQDNPSLFHLP